MIRLSLGNVGGGKTASEVKNIILNPIQRKTYSNIYIKNCPWNIPITKDKLILAEKIREQKHRDGSITPIFNKKLNVDFWESINEPVNIVLDEAGLLLNARMSKSKQNIIMGQFLSLCRRVIEKPGLSSGELVIIGQLGRQIDVIARELSAHVRYHFTWFVKECKKCGHKWQEHNEFAEPKFICPKCSSAKIIKHSHETHVLHFLSIDDLFLWKYNGEKTYYRYYIHHDIDNYIGRYDSYSWANMFMMD